MEITVKTTPARELTTDLLVLGIFQDQNLSDGVHAVDQVLGGALADALARQEFEPKLLKTWTVHTLGRLPARRVLLIGLGPYADVSPAAFRDAAGQVAQMAESLKAESMVFDVPPSPVDVGSLAQALAEGLLLGAWQFPAYQKTPPRQYLKTVTLTGLSPVKEAEKSIGAGIRIAQAQNFARELGFRPSNKLYPELLAEAAREAGQRHGFTVEIFDQDKLAELGMGALMGVGQGSAHPPRMVVMRYHGNGQRTLALIGKGITFDSGGISLKPAAGMEEMKYDMLGAAAVLGAMCAIADLKPAINVIGVMAIAQNMPSATAYKPGDVLTAFNGMTIEITNTDAEGRVALADAVSYAAGLGVDWMVEASTLTGAAITVLGHEATALVSPDDALASLVLQAAQSAGERVWRLPIYPEYKELYKSDVADIKNAPGRDAGTITAGMIIAEFAGNVPFVHLDIAGTAWRDKTPLNRTKNGPTGVMVRTFVTLAHMLAE